MVVEVDVKRERPNIALSFESNKGMKGLGLDILITPWKIWKRTSNEVTKPLDLANRSRLVGNMGGHYC